MYDLVGWIFSVTGTTPASVTRENYYYPLAGLYSIFCRRLIGEVTNEPQMVQLSFFTQTVSGASTGRIVIGATLDELPNKIKEPARVRRAQILVNFSIIRQEEVQSSNVQQPRGSRGQKFGHCAETFPFLFLNSWVRGLYSWKKQLMTCCRIKSQVNWTAAAGFAVQTTTAISDDEHAEEQFSLDALRNSLINPCGNCRVLIERMKLTMSNFEV